MDRKKLVIAPLIFVPGILGSQIFKRGSGESLWPPRDWWNRNDFKPKSLRDIIKTETREISLNEPLFPLIYDGLLRHLENMGYIMGQNFWIFAYDWTQSNRKSGQALAEFIKNVLSAQPDWLEVDVISHSMGGLVTRSASALYHAAIGRAVYIASPHYGSPKAFFILQPQARYPIFGNFFKSVIGDLAWNWYMHGLPVGGTSGMEKEVKWLSRQMDSMFELLPDRFYLDDKHPLVIYKVLSKSTASCGVDETYYTGPARFSSPEVRQRVKAAMAFKDELGASLPGKKNLVIYSDSEVTMDQVTYHEHLPWHFGSYRDSGQKGDWLVPTDSATLNNKFEAIKVPGSHNAIPNDEKTIQLIEAFLLGSRTSSQPPARLPGHTTTVPDSV